MRKLFLYLAVIVYLCLSRAGYTQPGEPNPDTFEPFSYICATDPHLTPVLASAENLGIAAREAQQNGCETLLVTGDLFNVVDSSAPYLWTLLRNTVSTFTGRLALMPGNHDIANLDQLALYRSLSGIPDYYSFRIHDCVFICLDTETLIHEGYYYFEYHAQWDWLIQELESARQAGYRRLFIFGHHPPYNNNQDELPGFWNMPRLERQRLLDLVRQYGACSIASGHWHTTKAMEGDNPKIYITAGSSYSVDGSGCGYRYFIVGRREVRQFYVRTDGPQDKTAPTTPTLFGVAGRTTRSLTFEWARPTDNVGVSRYEIWRDGAPLIRKIYEESYTDNDMRPGEEHTYSVVAFDPIGNRSEFAAPVTASLVAEEANLVTTQSLWRWSAAPVTDDNWKTSTTEFADGDWFLRQAGSDSIVTTTGLAKMGADPNTSYFRRVFTADGTTPAKLWLRLQLGEASATVYLNGGTIATYDGVEGEDGWVEVDLDCALLRPGDNLLAVELATNQSPVMNLELNAEPPKAKVKSWQAYQ